MLKKTTKKAPQKKPQKGLVGQQLTVKLPNGDTFEGECVSERETLDGKQVFLNLKGQVSRYFNVEDIVK